MSLIRLSVLVVSVTPWATAFVPPISTATSRSNWQGSPLNGLSQWRADHDEKADDSPTKTRSLHLLPFPASEALLPGQTTRTVLKQGRYFDMLENVTEHCHSILGMLLMGEDGFLSRMPLCEIVDWEVKSGFRGRVSAEVTLRSVGHAKLVAIRQMKPLILGECQELRLSQDEDDMLKSNNIPRRQQSRYSRQESTLLAEELVQGIERMLRDGDNSRDRLNAYNTAYAQTLEIILQNDPPEVYFDTALAAESGIRSTEELGAASWAMFACLNNNNCRSLLGEAFSCNTLVERLQLGRKALLEESFRTMEGPQVYGIQDDDDLNVIGFE